MENEGQKSTIRHPCGYFVSDVYEGQTEEDVIASHNTFCPICSGEDARHFYGR